MTDSGISREVQHVVAGEATCAAQTGDIGKVNLRSGGNEKRFCGDGLLASTERADAHSRRVDERPGPTDKIKVSFFQLLAAVVGEFIDQPPLPREDLADIVLGIFNAKPEFGRVTNCAKAVGRFNQALARHAPAKDAEPSDITGPLDDTGLQTGAGCGSRRGISGAASPDDDEVVVHATRSEALGRRRGIFIRGPDLPPIQ